VFVSRLWQIHAFGEGNTRTTAVFFIKYLRTLGFDVTNEIFAENAWYFRNALVRANYTNLKKGVHETTEYLELFLRNLLLGENNELKNRNLHTNCTLETPKCQNVTLDVTLEESQVLKLLKNDNKLTQKQIAELISKSDRTVKRIISSLEEKGIISREGGKRFGFWKVNI
jgi:predicted HTH transcriptional regulator